MENMLLILYPVLGSLGAKGCPWGAEMEEIFPQCGNLARGEDIYTPRGQFWRDLWQLEYTESMDNMFLMFCHELGLLGAKGATWGAEMQGNCLENRPRTGKESAISEQNRLN